MPKLREPPQRAPTPEPIAAPPDEPVEIELTEELPDSTEVDLASGASTPVAAGPPAPAIEHTPPAGDDNALQNALDAQKRAEALQQQAQRDRDAAIRNAQQREQELARERGDREQAQYDTVLSALGAAQSELESAKRDLKVAGAANDWETIGEAQARIATAAGRIQQLEDGKAAFESRREQPPEPSRREVPQPQPNQLPKSAVDWLDAHPEYRSGVKNAQIGYVHQLVVEQEGHAAFSPAYFAALETHLGIRQAAPDPVATTPPAAQPQRSMPVSAPVSRQAPSVSTGRANPGKITLTPEQRHIARNSFTDPNMTNEQKELLYARNLAKLNAQKANGSYRDERHQQ